MGLAIIFSLVTLFALAGVIRQFKSRNVLGIAFSLITVAVFGWFSFMTIYSSLFGSGQ